MAFPRAATAAFIERTPARPAAWHWGMKLQTCEWKGKER